MAESWLLYRKYFLTKGRGVSKVSKLNAFDKALMSAGISQCNLVTISSILPRNAVEVDPVEIPPGTVTFVVMAREDGSGGDRISAGVAIALCEEHGLIAEAHGKMRGDELRTKLEERLHEMAEVRGFGVKERKTIVESMVVPEGMYGCVISAVVLVP